MACRSQKLREDLTCAICYELFWDPVMLECMHHFCKQCIQGYWERCSRVATCPQCRQEIPTRSFRRHCLVSEVVETVRQSTSEEHKSKVQKASAQLNSKIRAEFEHLREILGAEERTVLMDLAREEEQWMMRLQGDATRIQEEISELKEYMENIQQKLEGMENSMLLEEEAG